MATDVPFISTNGRIIFGSIMLHFPSLDKTESVDMLQQRPKLHNTTRSGDRHGLRAEKFVEAGIAANAKLCVSVLAND